MLPTRPRVVLDASSLVGAALREDSTPRRAMAFALGYGHIFVSAVVVMEYRRVLTGPKLSRLLSRRRAEQIIDEILREAVLLDPEISIRECRDPSDDAYLELATAAAAHVIISSDHDLLVLDPWRGVRIVTPAQFLTLAAAGT